MNEVEDIVAKIEIARKERGMSYSQLAEAADVAETSVTRVMRGETPNPGYLTISKMLRAVGLSQDAATAEMPAISGNDAQDLLAAYQHMVMQTRLDYGTRMSAMERAARKKERDDKKIIRGLVTLSVVLGVLFLAYLMYDILNGNVGVFRY